MKSSAITGIGVDIESIKRFRDKPFDENEKFYRRLFTDSEIEYCLSKKDPYPHFAARFCAKEAIKKAIPDDSSLGWKEAEITNYENGKPYMTLSSGFYDRSGISPELSIHVSLSHDATQAVALVIVERE